MSVDGKVCWGAVELRCGVCEHSLHKLNRPRPYALNVRNRKPIPTARRRWNAPHCHRWRSRRPSEIQLELPVVLVEFADAGGQQLDAGGEVVLVA